MGSRRALIAWLVTASLCGLAARARGDDPPEAPPPPADAGPEPQEATALAARVEESLKAKALATAAKDLAAEGRRLASAPQALRRVALALLASLPSTGLRDPDDTKTIILAVGAAAKAGPEGDGATPAVRDALALATLFVVAATALRGEQVAAEDWTVPLAELRALAESSHDAYDDLWHALEAVRRLGAVDAVPAAAVRAAAEAGAWMIPRSSSPVAEKTLWAARDALGTALGLVAEKPGDAKTLLPKALAGMAPYMKGHEDDSPYWRDWNLAVLAAKRLGVAGNSTLRMETRWAKDHYLEYLVPSLVGWEDVDEGEKSEQWLGKMECVRSPKIRYAITFWCYRWEVNYTLPDDTFVGGENVTGLIKRSHFFDLKLFAHVVKDDATAHGGLSGRFATARGYDIRGTDASDAPLRVRTWFFHGKMRGRTYMVDLEQVGDIRDKDPLIEPIIESIDEHSDDAGK